MRTSCVLAVVALLGCGPKSSTTGPNGRLPAEIDRYAGLRWVPADVTYAVASTRTDQLVAVAGQLVDALGMLDDVDAARLGREMSHELGGLDPLSAASLSEHGIDVARGAALFSRGLGPIVAVPLSDPQRLIGFIEEQRSHGAVVQVERVHDVDMYTWRPDREAALHWAVVGDWLLGHVEITDEREADGAWFESVWEAAGGFAADPDFRAALGEGRTRLGGDPPVVAVARVPALLSHPLVREPEACAATVGRLGRVIVVAGVEPPDARGAVVAEVQGGTADLLAHRLRVPAGWRAARGDAAIQLEAGFDLMQAAAGFGACVGEDLTRELGGVVGGRVFVHDLDVERLEGRAAFMVEVVDRAIIDRALDEIPGLSLIKKTRRLGGLEVNDVNLPMLPRFSFAIDGTTAVAALGGLIDQVLTGGLVAGDGELGRIELHPQALPAATWDQLLHDLVSRDQLRERLIGRLQLWTLGQVILTADDHALIVTLHGRR